MRLLTRSQLRFLRQAPWSAAAALVGVALGVASVVAVHLIGVQVQRSLEAAAPHLEGLSHVLDRPGMSADHYFDLRDAWRNTPHSPITGMVPLLEGQLLLERQRVQVVGADWLAMPPGAGATGHTGDTAMAVPEDVLVGEAVLADTALERSGGETISAGGRRFRVAGTVASGLGPALFADIAAVQVMLDVSPQAVSRVGVAVEDPWAAWRRRLDALMPGFAAGLPEPVPPDPEALLGLAGAGEWQVTPVAVERPSASFARSVLFNLGALGTLALVVSWFLIYQVGVIWLRRQRLLLERLHVIGVAPAALRQSFLAVFAAIGTVATVAGTAAGLGLAPLLVELSSRGAGVAAGEAAVPGFDGWVAAKAMVSGLGVCLVGGHAAFSREWRPRTRTRLTRRLLVGLLAVLLVAGTALEATGVLGGFGAVFALSLLGVALVVPALAGLHRASLHLRLPLVPRLALREVAWYPRVLSVALAALALAVATGIGIGLMVDSFRTDFERMLESRLSGDLYLSGVAGRERPLDAWLDERPGVAKAVWSGGQRVRVSRGTGPRGGVAVPVELGYARFDAAEGARYGHSGGLSAGEALISERVARELDAAPGDHLQVAQGRVRVVGVFPGFGDPLGRVLVDIASLDELGVTASFDRVTLHLADDARVDAALVSAFPGVEVESRRDIRELALRVFDRTFAIARALTLLALLVSVVGMYNALTALRLNQSSTALLLRAQGLPRAWASGVNLLRSLTAGAVAVLLAIPLGVAMAWLLCTVINPRSFGWTVSLQPSLAAVVWPVLVGLGAALLAGVLPAPREGGALDES